MEVPLTWGKVRGAGELYYKNRRVHEPLQNMPLGLPH